MADGIGKNLLVEDLTLDEEELLDEILSDLGGTRRQFLGKMTAASLGTLVVQFLAKRNVLAGTIASLAPAPMLRNSLEYLRNCA